MLKKFFPLAFILTAVTCAPLEDRAVDSSLLSGEDETIEASERAITGGYPVGTELTVVANVNLRTGPSTSYSIVRVIAEGSTVTLVKGSPTSGYYRVKHGGTTGWSYGKYLTPASDSPDGPSGGSQPDSNPAPVSGRDEIIARAKSAVGFSYWWGHGRFREGGPTPSTKGYCNGSCPNCTHSGAYGGDCSGMVAKAWKVPSTNVALDDDQHPYSTIDFNQDNSKWYTVSRSKVDSGDAFVYRTSTRGHIMIYAGGDVWGSADVYECRGCSDGCVHHLRTISSAYHAIRRSGL